ncbi:MAG: hypothetical protein KF819_05870 [Labilithrix sp.]|nr:hypothetical protein [Labilithrix sp.]
MASFPDAQFETLQREDLGDHHGAIPHRGRLRCRTCGSTFGYRSELSSTNVTRESEIDRVIAALREGKRAQVGGGRCFKTYVIEDGQPIMITSDDGFTEEIPITEARLREAIAVDRSLFLDYLRVWQR